MKTFLFIPLFSFVLLVFLIFISLSSICHREVPEDENVLDSLLLLLPPLLLSSLLLFFFVYLVFSSYSFLFDCSISRDRLSLPLPNVKDERVVDANEFRKLDRKRDELERKLKAAYDLCFLSSFFPLNSDSFLNIFPVCIERYYSNLPFIIPHRWILPFLFLLLYCGWTGMIVFLIWSLTLILSTRKSSSNLILCTKKCKSSCC